MKLERKSISDLPHKWKFAGILNEYVIIDLNNSNFHEYDGFNNAICKIIHTNTGTGRQIRFNNVIYELPYNWEE